MLQNSKAFDFVFYLMLFGAFMGLVLLGGILALIAHLVGTATWFVFTIWALPPLAGVAAFLGLKRGARRS